MHSKYTEVARRSWEILAERRRAAKMVKIAKGYEAEGGGLLEKARGIAMPPATLYRVAQSVDLSHRFSLALHFLSTTFNGLYWDRRYRFRRQMARDFVRRLNLEAGTATFHYVVVDLPTNSQPKNPHRDWLSR